jgi:hypothetical protein
MMWGRLSSLPANRVSQPIILFPATGKLTELENEIVCPADVVGSVHAAGEMVFGCSREEFE